MDGSIFSIHLQYCEILEYSNKLECGGVGGGQCDAANLFHGGNWNKRMKKLSENENKDMSDV